MGGANHRGVTLMKMEAPEVWVHPIAHVNPQLSPRCSGLACAHVYAQVLSSQQQLQASGEPGSPGAAAHLLVSNFLLRTCHHLSAQMALVPHGCG